ncbi:NADP-dependent oxidoreductase [Actinomadura rudentiformis]|uniref:NADP-dependent oxidoreductase n=1 Tax=Actinomadura rudentiformis TaxID=359158 RepID=A0A6H9YQV6_9ACTN|nr:NADP-dependent oxidoreductase [Actinomadura rudentiformis]KAB2344020.1 NADP-dependent oxidoreductase [Actinomadura rudentiformis]
MRAIAVSEFGATPALMNLPVPAPGPGEMLVKMVAAGLNPTDWKISDGMLKDEVDHAFPLVMGMDGAGVVEAVGEGVTPFRPGDQVYGQFFLPPRGLGSFAEFAIAGPGAAVAKMPDSMIYSEAAAVPTATMTAFNMVETAGVGVGHTVLIVGATGGVGQSAVQLAAGRGAKVIATAHADMADEMRRLGAAETVDYGGADRPGDVSEQVLRAHSAGIDEIIDLVSDQAGVERLAGLLRLGGTYISSVWAVHPDKMAAQALRGLNFDNEASPALLAEIAGLIDAGSLRITVREEVSIEDAPATIARARAGGSRGKIVIRP